MIELATRNVDVLVVGAGPAGLACAVALSSTGLKMLLVDQGKPLVDRIPSEADDLVSGQGGAGLYSDGKFSFYPSASALWGLAPSSDLHTAFRWVTHLLTSSGMKVPSLPFPLEYTTLDKRSTINMSKKSYQSKYMSPMVRHELIDNLLTSTDCEILFGTQVVDLSIHTNSEASRAWATLSTVSNGRKQVDVVAARTTILSGGRFGALTIGLHDQLMVFRRIELGVRIQQPAQSFFLCNEEELDPKYTATSKDGACCWRTFCCCRNGKIVKTRLNKWMTLSGRADCEPTGLSNVGFNVRITDDVVGRDVWRQLAPLIQRSEIVTPQPLSAFMESHEHASFLQNLTGNYLAEKLREGLTLLAQRFGPGSLDQATLHWPTVEGVGYYPAVNDNLRVGELPIWTVGDMSGKFRGITAALVSGYFAGLQILRFLNG